MPMSNKKDAMLIWVKTFQDYLHEDPAVVEIILTMNGIPVPS